MNQIIDHVPVLIEPQVSQTGSQDTGVDGGGLADIRAFISGHCVHRRGEERLISTNGGSLNWLIDLRPAFLNARILSAIAAVCWARVRERMPCQIAGMEVAAIPLLAAVQLAAHADGEQLNAVIIRKERKKTGRGRRTEGNLSGAYRGGVVLAA